MPSGNYTCAIAIQAKAFLQAYETLNDSLLEKMRQGDFELAPIIVPAMTCVAFAAELAMKALIVQIKSGELTALPKNKNGGGIHNLDDLFNEVSTPLQQAIARELNKSVADVERKLRENEDAFVKWRYSFENGAMGDEEFLLKFVNAALAQVRIA
ncbi:hypothetical protein [Rhodanobacter sp. C03]|uniref:hypothetical protein n=1 Tax=Rhodanobacter sp. C03 TaxID=1945858 RepID=UPI000986B4C8|nr:hypothetical protein [Rhodanobacter sp. C03]OOG56452.1 hypothetical protein B0E48_09925 [Rhodanobacter sp. C03]